MKENKGESRKLFEWVKAKELKEIDWPLCIKLDGGGAPHYVTVCSMEELQSHVSHFNSIEEIQFARPIPQSSLKEEIFNEIPDIEQLIEKFLPNQFDLSSYKPKEILFMKSVWQHGAIVMFHQLKNASESSLTPKSIRDSDGWISVEDLPKKGNGFAFRSNDLLISNINTGEVSSGYYDIEHGKWYHKLNDITHWQPLPAPPNEKAKSWTDKQDSLDKAKSASLKPNKISDSAEVEKIAEEYAERVCNGGFPIEYTREQVVKHTKSDFIEGANFIKNQL